MAVLSWGIRVTCPYQRSCDLSSRRSSDSMFRDSRIETNYGCIIVAVIYRHPETNFQTFEISLTNLLVELENQKLYYVVCGDININSLALNNTKIKNYLNSLNCVGCRLLIEASTRFSTTSKPSLLDHIYSNITRKTLLSKPCLFDISDH